MVLKCGKKEIRFTKGYKKKSVYKVTDSLMNRWIVWKTVIYNINNDSSSKMKLFLNNSSSKHWVEIWILQMIEDGIQVVPTMFFIV